MCVVVYFKKYGSRAYFFTFFKIDYQPYHSKGLGESFPLMRLNIDLS